MMKKVFKISKFTDQDNIRCSGILNLSPNKRVEELLRFQDQFFQDLKTRIKKTYQIRKLL